MDKIPFPDAKFDFVSTVCVYHHVPPTARQALTREVARVIKPGGWFAIIEHNPWNPVTRLIVQRSPVDVDAILLPNPESRALLEREGFSLQPTEYFLYLPERLYRPPLTLVESMCKRLPLGGQYAVFGRRP
jgi:SAM-dependent methyltransferase